MDIEYLRRFIAVSRCLNFSEAANMLFISQPTLSHSITMLEKELGFPLLVRNSKSVKLMPEGKRFLSAAIQIVDLYQKAIDEISKTRIHSGNELDIGYVGPPLDNIISASIRTFRKAHPEVAVHVMRYSLPMVIKAFENHIIHLSFLTKINADKIPGLNYQEVHREKFRVCVSAEHPLAKHSKISLSMLKDEPFLITERNASPNYFDRVREICKNRNYEPKIFQKTESISNLYGLVSAGLGVAIISYSETRSYDAYNIKFIDIEDGDDLMNGVVLAWMDELSPLGCQFKDAVIYSREE